MFLLSFHTSTAPILIFISYLFLFFPFPFVLFCFVCSVLLSFCILLHFSSVFLFYFSLLPLCLVLSYLILSYLISSYFIFSLFDILTICNQAESLGSTVAGLALVYSMYFTQNLTFLTRAHSDSQMNMNSVERVIEYCNVAQEKYQPDRVKEELEGFNSTSTSLKITDLGSNGSIKTKNTNYFIRDSFLPSQSKVSTQLSHPLPELSDVFCESSMSFVSTVRPLSLQPRAMQPFVPDNWPSEGRVVFDGLSMRYRDNAPPVLR